MEPLCFGCDAMMGTLARWLRFAGFDVLFDPALDDGELAERCRREGRWLLSRDRALVSGAGPRALLMTGEGLAGQVAELRRRLPLSVDPALFFSRCSRCNGVLEEAPRAEVAALVPPFVAVHAACFARCPACGQIYWPGTHHARIARRLAELFVEPSAPEA